MSTQGRRPGGERRVEIRHVASRLPARTATISGLARRSEPMRDVLVLAGGLALSGLVGRWLSRSRGKAVRPFETAPQAAASPAVRTVLQATGVHELVERRWGLDDRLTVYRSVVRVYREEER